MHYFLIIYLFSTSSVFVTEFPTLKECNKARKVMIRETSDSTDIEKITCEKGYILEEFEVE
jgi:hypothetical protein